MVFERAAEMRRDRFETDGGAARVDGLGILQTRRHILTIVDRNLGTVALRLAGRQ